VHPPGQLRSGGFSSYLRQTAIKFLEESDIEAKQKVAALVSASRLLLRRAHAVLRELLRTGRELLRDAHRVVLRACVLRSGHDLLPLRLVWSPLRSSHVLPVIAGSLKPNATKGRIRSSPRPAFLLKLPSPCGTLKGCHPGAVAAGHFSTFRIPTRLARGSTSFSSAACTYAVRPWQPLEMAVKKLASFSWRRAFAGGVGAQPAGSD
jgi:hypothetical protein